MSRLLYHQGLHSVYRPTALPLVFGANRAWPYFGSRLHRSMSHSVSGTLGAFLIGVIIVSISYGVLVVQTYLYFQYSDSDSRRLKSSIVSLWILGTIHEALVCHGIYTEAVLQYNDPLALEVLPWSIIAILPLTSIMNLAIRSIFVFRIWRYSGRKWYLAILIVGTSLYRKLVKADNDHAQMLLSVTELGIALGFMITDLSSPRTIARTYPTYLFVGLAINVLTDGLVTTSQTRLLWKSRTGTPRTDSALRVLMIYSLSTGLLTTMFVMASFITWIAMSTNRIYLTFFCANPSLLLNTLLATLNGRRHLREMLVSDSPDQGSETLASYAMSNSDWIDPYSASGFVFFAGSSVLAKKGIKQLPPLPIV
ncbi:hypothetical protein CERSUDRAFT_126826 [Gelatoporia subvermispora B]|uniref:DUF6534 domain-containing protein n=1 Tax=Ceriporiopsis subvermispora (strain B) TaxID=914234 RepID=M2R2H6_CERS8|nr:hypothetical protein CERSUDRAFT_126826 [Gelatoporia subvermispora B]